MEVCHEDGCGKPATIRERVRCQEWHVIFMDWCGECWKEQEGRRHCPECGERCSVLVDTLEGQTECTI